MSINLSKKSKTDTAGESSAGKSYRGKKTWLSISPTPSKLLNLALEGGSLQVFFLICLGFWL